MHIRTASSKIEQLHLRNLIQSKPDRLVLFTSIYVKRAVKVAGGKSESLLTYVERKKKACSPVQTYRSKFC